MDATRSNRCDTTAEIPAQGEGQLMTNLDQGGDGLADTARLRGPGSFPSAQVLLGELITDRKLVPSGSQTVQRLDALPSALKASLQRAERQGKVWCGWNCNGELSAIAGCIDDVSSRMYAKPVLSVFLYDGKGRVIGSSKWLEVLPNQWTDCEG
jgi:hypothetical protein